MNKREIAQVLEEIAFFLLLKGENPYKARAYRNAATALLTCQEDTFVLVETGMLRDVPGIGPATASVITELVTTGLRPPSRRTRGVSVYAYGIGACARIKHEADQTAL